MFENEIKVHAVYEELGGIGEFPLNIESYNERAIVIGDSEVYTGTAYLLIFSHHSTSRIVGKPLINITQKMLLNGTIYKIEYKETEGGFYEPEISEENYFDLNDMPLIINRFIKIFSAQFLVFRKMLPGTLKAMSMQAATFELERNATLLDYKLMTNTETRMLYTAFMLDLTEIEKRDYKNIKERIKEQKEELKEIEKQKSKNTISHDEITMLSVSEKIHLENEFSDFLIKAAIDSFLDNKDFEGLKKFVGMVGE